jgi:GT2 family glycosyltransferase
MQIAYIGHNFHQRSRSTTFFIDLLRTLGNVELFAVDPTSSAEPEWYFGFTEEKYDIIVLFQVFEPFDMLSGRHDNVIFVPMYDSLVRDNDYIEWKSIFNTVKVLCLSWNLRRELMRQGTTHAHFQYYPNPEDHPQADYLDSLHGLFWYRRREITPEFVFDLCKNTEFQKFIIHYAPDPGHENDQILACAPPPNILSLQHTFWSDSASKLASMLRESNVFFAPRHWEGIGMSVLEAMATGLCVVAHNGPTMSEYISNGNNGLLYDRFRHAALEFSGVQDIGRRARESMQRGYERWSRSTPALLQFVATPANKLQSKAAALYTIPSQPVPAPHQRADGNPLISVVTVCRNAASVLEGTINSVVTQKGVHFEYVVRDGSSTDETIQIIQRHKNVIASMTSGVDKGPYDAMNKSFDDCKGGWVLFMNAGDLFVGDDALYRMFARMPDDASVVYGHHVYRYDDGTEELHRAAEFETSWSRLQRGDLSFDWLSGIPGHQATAVRRELLDRLRFDLRYFIAADHELLFRARKQGARFFNCDELLAIYVSGGLSAQQYDQCRREYAAIARTYGNVLAADQFYGRLEDLTRLNTALGRLRSRLSACEADSAKRLSDIHTLHAVIDQLRAQIDRHRGSSMNRMLKSIARRLPRRKK